MKPVAIACLSIFALSAVAACSGGGSVPSTPSAFAGRTAPAAPDRGKGRKGKARIHIRIPHKKKHGRHGRYISPATKSIKIVAGGTTTVIANLTPSSPNCTYAGAFTECVVTVSSLLGAIDFSFTTYDGLGGSGNKLSANDVTFNVVSGATTPLSVTLGGIATSISFLPTASVPQITGSQAAGYNLYGRLAQNFTVVPMDADDNVIIGPGAPAVSMSAPPAGQLLGVATPAPATPNEWKLISSYVATNPLTPMNATVTAVTTPVPGSGGSTISAAVTVAQYEPWIFVTDYGGTLYVFDEQGNEIDLGANAWVGIPSPEGISFDSHNNHLYMAGNGDNVVYETDVVGNLVSPSPGAWSNVSGPATALYVPTNDHIYVPQTSASAPPTGVVAFDETGVTQPLSGSMSGQYGVGLAFDSHNGFVYLAASYLQTPAVLAYDINGNPQTLSGNFNGLGEADAVGYDSHNGFLYVANDSNSSITVYDEEGNVQSTTGSFPGLHAPTGITYDPYNGLIYVADFGGEGGGTGVYTFDEQGNPQTIPFTEDFSEAYGITVVP